MFEAYIDQNKNILKFNISDKGLFQVIFKITHYVASILKVLKLKTNMMIIIAISFL